MIEYIKTILVYYLYFVAKVFHRSMIAVGRVFEGIAIGLYANLIGEAVDGIEVVLIYKAFIAIMMTAMGAYLQNKPKDS